MNQSVTRKFYRGFGRLNQIVNKIETRLERNELISRPVNVDLVITKACNFACVFCKDYDTPDGALRISLDNVERVAKQLFPYAMKLSICSGGEPYLHKQLEDILRIAKRYALNTWVLSNGSILKEERVRTMVREELITEHGFSVDGYYPETVAAIRVNANLEAILKNIEMLQHIKRKENKTHPKVIIRYALMRTNIEELPLAITRWGEMGVDEMHCGYLSLANNMDEQLSLYYHQELMAECFEKAREVAKCYPGLKVSLPLSVKVHQQITAPKPCTAPRSFVMIDTNGEVMPCYRTFEALRVGRLYDEGAGSFYDLWNSQPYQELRRTVNNDSVEKYFPYCKYCESRCGWGSEKAHLGDKNWMEVLGPNWLPVNIDHKRPVRGSKPA